MKKSEVPQDGGMAGNMREIAYAVDENGHYVKVESLGWEPKIVALKQAWGVISQEVEDILEKIKAGKLSPLAFHMAKNQMSLGLLSDYMEIAKWRVKRHMKPKIFNRLKPDVIEKYASVFGITAKELKTIPNQVAQELYKDNITKNK